LPGTNILAYLASSLATNEKSFITLTPGVKVIKLFVFVTGQRGQVSYSICPSKVLYLPVKPAPAHVFPFREFSWPYPQILDISENVITSTNRFFCLFNSDKEKKV